MSLYEDRTEAAAADDHMLHTLQHPTPLNNSILWEMQRAYYDSTGTDAWESGVVPSFITTNAFIARSYARLVLSYLRYIFFRWTLSIPFHWACQFFYRALP
jgi:hypothetical protein